VLCEATAIHRNRLQHIALCCKMLHTLWGLQRSNACSLACATTRTCSACTTLVSVWVSTTHCNQFTLNLMHAALTCMPWHEHNVTLQPWQCNSAHHTETHCNTHKECNSLSKKTEGEKGVGPGKAHIHDIYKYRRIDGYIDFQDSQTRNWQFIRRWKMNQNLQSAYAYEDKDTWRWHLNVL